MHRGPAVSPRTEGAEAGAGLVLGDTERGDGHETAELKVGEVGETLEKLGGFGRGGVEASLGLFGA